MRAMISRAFAYTCPRRAHSHSLYSVLITGAAGQIGYSLTPLVANGTVFGLDQPVILHLLGALAAFSALCESASHWMRSVSAQISRPPRRHSMVRRLLTFRSVLQIAAIARCVSVCAIYYILRSLRRSYNHAAFVQRFVHSSQTC